jgi:hypothetical protein
MPDWLRRVTAAEEPAAAEEQLLPPMVEEVRPEMPGWLRRLQGKEVPLAETAREPVKVEEPEWLERVRASAPPEEMPPAPEEMEIPDWLRAQAAAMPIMETYKPEPMAPMEIAAPELAAEAEMPDRMGEPVAQLAEVPAPIEPVVAEEAAELPEWIREIAPEGVEPALEPAEIPEWLQAAQPSAEEGEPIAAPVGEEGLAPAQIPAWLETLRPIEEEEAEEMAASMERAEVETSGVLAGLSGALAAMPVIAQPRPQAVGRVLALPGEEAANVFATVISESPSPISVVALTAKAKKREREGAPRQRSLIRWIIYALL